MSMIRGVRRIRIGSLEPIQIDDAFMELLDEPWMAKTFAYRLAAYFRQNA